MANINQHIRDYLDRYLKRRARYAILIGGEWGSGKTHLIRHYFRNSQATLIVSTNGIGTTRDLTERLYLAAYPVLGDKTVKALGSITKTIAGAFRIESNLQMEDLLELDQFKTLVIDDIERSDIPINELLGYLNEFVEHDDKHLILVGSEREIRDQETYKRIKEKVVGFTLRVEPDYESALDAIRTSDKDFKDFLNTERPSIISILEEGALGNLRILENTIEEAEGIYHEAIAKGLTVEQARNIFFPFFLLSYYYRKGTINEADLRSRQSDGFARGMSQARDGYVPEGIDALDRLYSQVDLFTTDFDNDFLVARICEGREATDLLDRTLGDIRGRSNPSSNPEWRNLWYFLHQDDDVIRDSFDLMMHKFKNREYDEAGVILHVFGLLFNMRNFGLLTWSIAEIEEQGRAYIDDLLHAERLPVMESEDVSSIRYGSAHGLGFTSSDEPGFRRLFHYLKIKSSEGVDRKIEADLVDLIKNDPFDVHAFRAILLQGERDDNIYNRPFLSRISANDLATAIIKESAEVQFEILHTLSSRYNHSPYVDVKSSESSWLRKLIHALRRIPKSKVSRARLNKTIAITIMPASTIN